MDPEADPIDYCKTVLGLSANQGFTLPTLKHCFTHFRLHISPLLLNVGPDHASTLMAHQRWFTKQDVIHTAVPTPVRKLLLQF